MQDGDAHTAPMAPLLDLYFTCRLPPQEDRVPSADATPENPAWLKAYRGRQLGSVNRAALLEEAVFGLARRFPELSAQKVLTRPQAVTGLLLVMALAGAFALSPSRTWHVMVVALSLAFGINSVFRALLALMAPRAPLQVPVGEIPLASYTVLVPLYREAAVLPALVDSLLALDYPRDLLDVKLVVEEDDAQTVAAAHAQAARHTALDVIEVPVGGPRTKPKAANYALAFARGEYLVVYDAEDRPEPDQLKKSVATFHASSPATACLQARLHIHNGATNWLAGVLS